MNDKTTRELLLKMAGKKADELRQQTEIGDVLGLIASAPFAEADATDYLLNAIIATQPPAKFAEAYALPMAVAEVLHAKAVANVTMKKREGKPTRKSGLAAAFEAVLADIAAGKSPEEIKAAASDKPDEDCQCPGCKVGRILQGLTDSEEGIFRDPDGTMTIALEFGAKSAEEAKEMNERFSAEVAKGRNPFEVAKEMGGRLSSPAEVERAAKEGRATVQHMDASGKPLTPH